MRKKGLSISLLLMAVNFCHAQQSNINQKFIEITGYATTATEPDIIYYTISLPNNKYSEDEKEAVKEDSVDVTVERKIKEDNNLKWIKIREILGQQNLKEEENPDSKNYTIGNKYGLYTIGNSDDEVTVKVSNLVKLETLIKQLKTIKGCKGSISKEDNSNTETLREKTLMKALANAKDKATKIAAQMNVKLGKVIQITEQTALNGLIGNLGKEATNYTGLGSLLNKEKSNNGKMSFSDSIVVRFAIEE